MSQGGGALTPRFLIQFHDHAAVNWIRTVLPKPRPAPARVVDRYLRAAPPVRRILAPRAAPTVVCDSQYIPRFVSRTADGVSSCRVMKSIIESNRLIHGSWAKE